MSKSLSAGHINAKYSFDSQSMSSPQRNSITAAGNNQNRSAIDDPDSLLRARKNYHDLQDLLNSLGARLTDVSSQVDKEFLSSYRVHMLGIQSEVRHLKQEVTESEQRLNDDVQVARLESETKWFIDECNRLRNHFDSMKSDCEQMKDRLRSMQEQKAYLGAQLKALVRRNRVLQDDINDMKGITNAFDAKYLQQHKPKLQRSYLASNSGNNMDSVSAANSTGGSVSNLPKSNSHSKLASDANKHAHTVSNLPDHKVNLASKKHSQSQPLLLRSKNLLRRSDKNQKSAPLLEEQVDKEQRYMQKLKEQYDERSLIEEELEKSIKEIFKEIQLRKLQSFHKSSTRLPTASSPSRPLTPSASSPHLSTNRPPFQYIPEEDLYKASKSYDDHHVSLPKLIEQAGGISGLGTHQFSDHDKFATMVNFLSKPLVLQEILKTIRREEEELY